MANRDVPSDPQAHMVPDEVLYYEESHPPFLPGLAILPFLLPFFWTYSVRVSGAQVDFGYSSFLPGLGLAILPFLLPFFWTYSVQVSGAQVDFGYSSGLTHKRMDRSLVLSAEPIDHVNGFSQWGGWGIRKNLQWETGYIASNGPAVRVKTKDKGGTYVFNCKDPQLVCQILNS